MTMILQLLALVMAVGLGVDDVVSTEIPAIQPYKQQLEALEDTAKTLLINVLSMEGHIPTLNDSRRHYAEIFHVANNLGRKKSIYPDGPYNETYYRQLETSAPQAINNPGMVISEVKYLLDDVHKKTKEIQELITACHATPAVCNEVIDVVVKQNPDKYGAETVILADAASAARVLKEKNGIFEEVSDGLRAHQYVCKSPNELWNLVMELAKLYRSLQ